VWPDNGASFEYIAWPNSNPGKNSQGKRQ
jgi:hypothetical protein